MRELTSLSDLERSIAASTGQPLLILKHSPRCHFCHLAHELIEDLSKARKDVVCTWVDVLDHRDVSDALAKKTGVTHESPQLFLYRNGQKVWHAGYPNLTRDGVEEHLG